MKRISMMRRGLVLLMALVMMFALAAPAMAAEQDAGTVKVTVVVQQQDDGATEPTTLFTTNELTVPAGTSVYDLIRNNVEEITATSWKTVDILDTETWQPTGQTGKVLESLTYEDEEGETYTLTNWGSNTPGSTSEAGSYAGQAWGYTVNGVEPEVYMDHYELTTNATIILNYQYSSFSWGNTNS